MTQTQLSGPNLFCFAWQTIAFLRISTAFPSKYQFGPNAIASVTSEGDSLKWRGGNRRPVTLVPLSEIHFFARETETEMMFVKDEKGQVTDVRPSVV